VELELGYTDDTTIHHDTKSNDRRGHDTFWNRVVVRFRFSVLHQAIFLFEGCEPQIMPNVVDCLIQHSPFTRNIEMNDMKNTENERAAKQLKI